MEGLTVESDKFRMPLIESDSQKRRRKKTNYKKINNQTRQKLIEMVSGLI